MLGGDGGDGGGGTGLAVQKGYFAEEIAGAQDDEDELVAILGDPGNAYAAVFDDVERIAAVAPVEDDVAAFVGFVAHYRGQAGAPGGLQALEQG